MDRWMNRLRDELLWLIFIAVLSRNDNVIDVHFK